MRRAASLLLALALATPAAAQDGIDALLKDVQRASAEAREINQEREARFLRNRNQQAALLKEAQGEQRAAKQRADAVKKLSLIHISEPTRPY